MIPTVVNCDKVPSILNVCWIKSLLSVIQKALIKWLCSKIIYPIIVKIEFELAHQTWYYLFSLTVLMTVEIGSEVIVYGYVLFRRRVGLDDDIAIYGYFISVLLTCISWLRIIFYSFTDVLYFGMVYDVIAVAEFIRYRCK